MNTALRDFIPADLVRLRHAARAAGQALAARLEAELGLDAESVMAALGRAVAMPVLDMPALDALVPDYDLLDIAEAARRHALVGELSGHLHLVLADPFDTATRAWLAQRSPRPFELALAHPADLAARIAREAAAVRTLDRVGRPQTDTASADDTETLSLAEIAGDSSPVVRLVRSTLFDALRAGASDIHLESQARGLVLRYRIDGVLVQAGEVAGADTASQVISRIKILAELDIAERRVPQDGRFKVAIDGREVDVRVSIMPSVFGEDAVLRLLDRQALADSLSGLTLEALGYGGKTLAAVRQLAAQPYGMLLVTGPTGSGKTTTLYAAISEIQNGQDKIITIEDPVEYQLPGVLQIPVNEKKGLTFARGLRSILRHDPDKIMVGEIRDPETAQIAVQAALTGHLVLTTVHANNVFDALGRFTHMGIDPYSFVSAVNGIVAQRLVRINCPHCSAPVPVPAALREAVGHALPSTPPDYRAGRGCGHCRGTGYKGRRAVAEILRFDDPLRERIAARAPIGEIKSLARQSGFAGLREAALAHAWRGETTLEEVNRVTLAG